MREFYFVRHGQTDHNAIEGLNKGDHPEDIALNEVGRGQAWAIEPLIAGLRVGSICASPLRRVQETREIIAGRLGVAHVELGELGECSAGVWEEMRVRGMYAGLPEGGSARAFMDRVRVGLERVLELPGPALVVAHGGVHWAVCCLLGVRDHGWALENCGVVHFKEGERWTARRLGGRAH